MPHRSEDALPATGGARSGNPDRTRIDLFASFAGRFWTSLMSLLFIPVYIDFMGMESYGLIGLFVSLIAVLYILDMGLGTTLSRELARLSTTDSTNREARDLVRTLETVYWGIGLGIGTAVALLAPAVARYWVRSSGLPPPVVEDAILLMGLVIAFEWPAALYTGGLMGLQRQVRLNGVRAGMSTVQFAGAALILWMVSPTITAYFLWQAAASATQTLLLAMSLRSSLPGPREGATFRISLLRKNWGFARGMMGISVAATILTQMDKLILSKWLPLEMFGYYMLAFNVANALNHIVTPVFNVFFPRFSRMVAERNVGELTVLYHKVCRLLSVLVLPVAITLALFSREVLLLWIGDAKTVDHTHVLLSVVIVGSAFNAIMTIPYTLQLANGWTRLSYLKNVVALVLLAPLLVLMIRRYAAFGGAIVWVMLNLGYFLIEIPLMHRRLLEGQMYQWYLHDVGLPLAVIAFIGVLSRAAMPHHLDAPSLFAWVAATAALTFFVSARAVGLHPIRLLRGTPR